MLQADVDEQAGRAGKVAGGDVDGEFINGETHDETQNAHALFGELYGGGLLGGPLEANTPHAHASNVASYASPHRRRGRGGSYFDALARSKVLDYSWGQHAKGRAAYSSDHNELLAITSARSRASTAESRRTVSRGLQASRGNSRGALQMQMAGGEMANPEPEPDGARLPHIQ